MSYGAVLGRALILTMCLATSAGGTGQPRVHVVNIYTPEGKQAVTIAVRDTRGPVVLALGSSEPTTWAIKLDRNVELKEIILQGGPRGPSRVVGTPPHVPVWSEIIGNASKVGDYGYYLVVHYVRERYGHDPVSFQIAYSGRAFEIK